MNENTPTIICFGEILWDILPGGRFPGGAPLNVAYHLKQLGLAPLLISAVGCDRFGDELIDRIRAWGLSTSGIVRHPHLPTGIVGCFQSPGGDVRYDIAANSAWDDISLGETVMAEVTRARALVYGSLGQRAESNRAALSRLLASLPADALRVFDVNLRPPYDNRSSVLALAGTATLLKVNAAEAARLTGGNDVPEMSESNARALYRLTRCPLLCLSAGPRGAGVLEDGQWHWEPSRPVKVVDTVGAGDAFVAGLLGGLLKNESAPTALARACRLGEYVASHHGATPPPGDALHQPAGPSVTCPY